MHDRGDHRDLRDPAEAKQDLAARSPSSARGAARGLALVSAGSHPFSHPHEQTLSPDPAVREAHRGDAVAGAAAADLRHPLPRRRALGREVDRRRERAAVPPRASARALGVEPVLGGPRHRPRVVPGPGVRGAADRGPAARDRRLGRLRAVHAHARGRRGDHDDPRGLVGRAPAPQLRDGRAADLRRDPDAQRDRRDRRARPVPRPAHRRQIDAGVPCSRPASG